MTTDSSDVSNMKIPRMITSEALDILLETNERLEAENAEYRKLISAFLKVFEAAKAHEGPFSGNDYIRLTVADNYHISYPTSGACGKILEQMLESGEIE